MARYIPAEQTPLQLHRNTVNGYPVYNPNQNANGSTFSGTSPTISSGSGSGNSDGLSARKDRGWSPWDVNPLTSAMRSPARRLGTYDSDLMDPFLVLKIMERSRSNK